jgi:Helix-turn-helix domain
MSTPDQPPEGILIESARRRAGLSVREAARRAGISEGWWRQIVKGYQSLSGGNRGEVKGPPDTVAGMARVVGVTPEQMETEGQRPDAAREMRKDLPPAAPRPQHQGGNSLLTELSRRLRLDGSPEYAALWGRIGLAADQHGIEADPDAPAAVLKGEWLWPRGTSPADAESWDNMAADPAAPTIREAALMLSAIWARENPRELRERGGAAGLPPGT